VSAEFHYRRLPWRGREEWMTELGKGPSLLLIPPLFEEMNRCRAILIDAGRVLAADGYRVHMPDLPGTGESEQTLRQVSWDEWRDFVAHLAVELKPVATLSVRGGSLLDPGTGASWRLSPVDGARITRELVRARRAVGDDASSDEIARDARVKATEFAGYPLAPTLYTGLDSALVPATPGRVVRLRGEAGPANRLIDAAPPWRTAEPRRDPELSQTLAGDIADWLSCAA